MSIQEQLVQLANNDPTALYLFEEFADRERDRSTTNLRKVRIKVQNARSVKLDRMLVREFFEKLEKLGLGKMRDFINSEGKEDDEFCWIYRQNMVGRVALGRPLQGLFKPHYKVTTKIAFPKPLPGVKGKRVKRRRRVSKIVKRAPVAPKPALVLKTQPVQRYAGMHKATSIMISLLRPGKGDITLSTLPADLTEQEANKLADLIRSIPKHVA